MTEHQKSKAHKKSVSDYITWCNDHPVEKHFEIQKEIRREYVREQHKILDRIINIITWQAS